MAGGGGRAISGAGGDTSGTGELTSGAGCNATVGSWWTGVDLVVACVPAQPRSEIASRSAVRDRQGADSSDVRSSGYTQGIPADQRLYICDWR